ncbi:imidazole glycerol phosphate synthase subunit HisF [Candidatus Falkowbacteria bacterium CG10_big_fil_rev_8_21_14_0_10_44_15]|uniref:imidazole glycerol-phosphate synthase n=1 Tax=Candidatus Falkowbacteria bacterium CG10_big_fil_rev_8_21_14_0_10_44_15 TaxID=1974569 RepID=A0A2H0UZL7_9BACT|nr:MAG: imidazole glycerol phosphate synthase subunit HisF [Candidatus Falkowbacteria bacterium CG10_big_fil_rev_8_21_14_0_10_44_15]
MLKIRVIPCMLFNGLQLVKTVNFEQMRTIGNPIQTARIYNQRNVDELVFIDITASQEKREPAFDLISGIFNECFMPLSVGGGIHNIEEADKLIKIGADKVIFNSEAINNPSFITKVAKKYGSQSVVVSIDVRKQGDKHIVFYERGLKNTGMRAEEWSARVERLGAGEIFLNSIDRDGTQLGYDIDLIKSVSKVVSLPVVACGGAGNVGHVVNAVKVGKADAVSLASLFHYTGLTPRNVKEALYKAGSPVRLM